MKTLVAVGVLAALAGLARAEPKPTLRAHFFDMEQGTWGDDLFGKAEIPSVGQADQGPNAMELLVVAGLAGEHSGENMKLTIKQGKKRIVKKLWRRSTAFENWFTPLLVPFNACDPMTLTLEVTGRKDKDARLEKKIDFVCGE